MGSPISTYSYIQDFNYLKIKNLIDKPCSFCDDSIKAINIVSIHSNCGLHNKIINNCIGFFYVTEGEVKYRDNNGNQFIINTSRPLMINSPLPTTYEIYNSSHTSTIIIEILFNYIDKKMDKTVNKGIKILQNSWNYVLSSDKGIGTFKVPWDVNIYYGTFTNIDKLNIPLNPFRQGLLISPNEFFIYNKYPCELALIEESSDVYFQGNDTISVILIESNK